MKTEKHTGRTNIIQETRWYHYQKIDNAFHVKYADGRKFMATRSDQHLEILQKYIN